MRINEKISFKDYFVSCAFIYFAPILKPSHGTQAKEVQALTSLANLSISETLPLLLLMVVLLLLIFL